MVEVGMAAEASVVVALAVVELEAAAMAVEALAAVAREGVAREEVVQEEVAMVAVEAATERREAAQKAAAAAAEAAVVHTDPSRQQRASCAHCSYHSQNTRQKGRVDRAIVWLEEKLHAFACLVVCQIQGVGRVIRRTNAWCYTSERLRVFVEDDVLLHFIARACAKWGIEVLVSWHGQLLEVLTVGVGVQVEYCE